MKPIMPPRLQPATSPNSSWNSLPSHFSLRLSNMGQWHKIFPTVSSSSSFSHNLQKSCVLPTPIYLKAPIEKCPVITPTKILILFLSNANSILVAFGFNFGHSVLVTLQSSLLYQDWLVEFLKYSEIRL
ncbi:hypothetical protein FF38_06133 [Lucilia cuprina]|uniref:Uncharacterized protein n=1 Tax=Lucilia cuprina TaxID=7375 RepID=A0A0L0C6L5_LUCCU|nr:hypothetical protein FF38_06133 [Lucilia cuprina]